MSCPRKRASKKLLVWIPAYAGMTTFLIWAAIIFLIVLPSAFLSADTIQPVSGTLRTSDNISISYDHYRRGFDSVVIVCPGFFNSKESRWMRKTAGILSDKYDVIIFDFRGHGKSGGKYTWSAKENLDLDAVVGYAESLGYKHIGVLAFSLGAAVAINYASGRSDIESMVLISCPSTFQSIDFHFWEPGMWADLKDNIDSRWEGKGARAGNILLAKESPLDKISGIKDTPILFISGDRDWVVKPRHSVKLYDAAKVYKRIEIIKGGFHAERLIQFQYETMRGLIMDWFSKTLR
jgi:pimeloyl-ACP methyl ester carboxylesterase